MAATTSLLRVDTQAPSAHAYQVKVLRTPIWALAGVLCLALTSTALADVASSKAKLLAGDYPAVVPPVAPPLVTTVRAEPAVVTVTTERMVTVVVTDVVVAEAATPVVEPVPVPTVPVAAPAVVPAAAPALPLAAPALPSPDG